MTNKEMEFVQTLKNGLLFREDQNLQTTYDRNAVLELEKQAENAVNNFGFHRDEVAAAIQEDALARTIMLNIAYVWIHFYGSLDEQNYLVDGRNEQMARICRRIVTTPEFHALGNAYFCEDGECYALAQFFVETASRRMHRTNQQSFAGLLFRLLDLQTTDEYLPIKNQMVEDRGNNWYRMMMI